MGGTHSRECNTIAKNIWQWCRDKQIWLTAAHIPGTKSVEADRESHVFSDNDEWMIRPDIFQKITDIWGAASIDLLASRLNHQVSCNVSWKPFSITWDKKFFYDFPNTYRRYRRNLQKASSPIQSWYPKLLHMLVDVPRVLPSKRTALQMPGMKQEVHPLIKKMVLIVCRLSGNPMRHRDFLKTQPLLSYSLEGKKPLSSTPRA